MIRKHKYGYDVSGYGSDVGALYNLSKDELHQLLIDISCQNINDEYDKEGKEVSNAKAR